MEGAFSLVARFIGMRQRRLLDDLLISDIPDAMGMPVR